MTSPAMPNLWLVREPDPLGSFLRPYGRDASHLANLLAAGRPTGAGIIVDGRLVGKVNALQEAAATRKQELILDSLGVELSSPHGLVMPGIKELPWLARRRYSPAPLTADERRTMCESLATTAVESGFTAVFTPTRFIQEIHRDEVADDIETTIELRQALDIAGGNHVRIYYPLVAGLRLIGSETARQGFLTALRIAVKARAIDALWIRASGFDATSGAINLRRYVSGVRGFHELGVPVVGDRAGTLGLAMLAFGVTSGISSGITIGERYDARTFFKPARGKGVLPAPRVYVPAIGAFMKKADAVELFRHASVKNWFACQRSCCSSHGIGDTIGDPRRHFVITRSEEVEKLARIPAELRASQYMEHWLRPASDRATKAMRIDPSLERHRNRLDNWRATFASILEEDAVVRPEVTRSPARLPERKGA